MGEMAAVLTRREGKRHFANAGRETPTWHEARILLDSMLKFGVQERWWLSSEANNERSSTVRKIPSPTLNQGTEQILAVEISGNYFPLVVWPFSA